jgi:predicted regulator of Ras-like GTPase activity (Roadblock/LC7/MglB family)
VLGAITSLLLTGFKAGHPESAAVEGKKVVLTMLAVGGIFVLVIAVGEMAHLAAKARRRRNS